MDLNKDIKVNIKAHFTQNSKMAFIQDIKRIESREYLKLQNAKYIIFLLYLQLGKPEEKASPVFEFRNKNEVYLKIQPKIKSYIIFKNENCYNEFLINELDDELYMVFEVENGKIKI